MDLQVTIPGGGVVASLTQRAKFYRSETGHDMVEISAVGSKDTTIRKVTPTDMAMFKAEWDAFNDGRPITKREGTPLTKVSGVNESRAEMYFGRNIHNAEELAALSDSQCQQLGHGVLTDRKAALALVATLAQEARVAAHDAVLKAAEKITPAAAPAPDELGKKIDALSDSVGALVALLTAQAAEKKKPGRPPKAKDE